jgi:hypothetical protein
MYSRLDVHHIRNDPTRHARCLFSDEQVPLARGSLFEQEDSIFEGLRVVDIFSSS